MTSERKNGKKFHQGNEKKDSHPNPKPIGNNMRLFDGRDLEKIKFSKSRLMLLELRCFGCGQSVYHPFVYYEDPLSNLTLDPEKLAVEFGVEKHHIAPILRNGLPTGYSRCGPITPMEIFAKVEWDDTTKS